MDQEAETEEAIKNDGLEQFLLDQGVDQKAIDASKKEIAQENKTEYRFYYDDTGKTERNIQIPVTQIKGISRVSGYSWFKLLECGLGVSSDIPKNSLNLEHSKFLQLVSSLAKTDLLTIIEHYQQVATFAFSCYEKDGIKKYYITNDGNHRTVTAKVYGLRNLPAHRVNYYVFNDAKYREFQLYKKHKNEADRLRASLGLIIEKSGDVIFEQQNFQYKITEFPSEEIWEDNPSISEMIEQMKQAKVDLLRMVKKSDFYTSLYSFCSKKIREKIYNRAKSSSNFDEPKQREKRTAKLIALNRLYNK